MSSWTSILSYCAPPPDICQINLGQIFASYNISHSLLQQIFVLQRFSVVVTTNIWFSHCYNLFALLQGLCVVTILLQRIHVVTILIQHIACNCYNLFDKHCNNGIFWLLQALQTPTKSTWKKPEKIPKGNAEKHWCNNWRIQWKLRQDQIGKYIQ